MYIYFFKFIFWLFITVFGICFIEAFWRLIVAFWKLHKTKFPFAKNFIPFIGHLNLIQSGQCPFNFSDLGPEKTYAIFRGTSPCLITSDPKLIKQICTKYANYFHSRMNVHVFGARGERWKRIRSITSFGLSTAQLRSMFPLIIEQTDIFINYLYVISSSSSFETDIHCLFQQLTAAVIGRCALGLPKNSFENPPKHFEFFKQIFGSEPSVSVNSETLQWIIPSMTKVYENIIGNLRSKTPIDKLNDFIGDLLADKIKGSRDADILQNFKNFETSSFFIEKEDNQNILNLSNVSKADAMGTEEIIAQSRFLSIAGFDTTANTLSFACLLLAENPEKLQRVFEEIDSIAGDKLNYDTLSKTPYIHAVLVETLRLFPHASMLQSRLCMSDCIIDDSIFIPSGVGILFDTWKLHRNPFYWGSNAAEFQPERHLTSAEIPDYFIPFGNGPRQCVGMRFALMEQKAVIIQFFKHFTVRLPPGISSKNLYISLQNTGTVWPKDLRLIIEKRNSFPVPA